MDKFSKYIGRVATLKDDSVVTIIDVLEDNKSGKILFYVKYDNGSIDSIYSNYIKEINDPDSNTDMDPDSNTDMGSDSGVDINNKIFAGESRMKKFNENYSIQELSDIFRSKNDRVQIMQNLADDDKITGVLLDFGNEVELEVTDADNFVDAMLEPLRDVLINKVQSLTENNMTERKKRTIKEGFDTEEARTLKEIFSMLGYDGWEEFIGDNEGARTALIEWLDDNISSRLDELDIEISEESAVKMEGYGLYGTAKDIRDRIANHDDNYDESNKNRSNKMEKNRRSILNKKSGKNLTEARATTSGFAGETVKINDPIMDISTNRHGFVKKIHENGDVEADFSGKMETHKIRTFMKI